MKNFTDILCFRPLDGESFSKLCSFVDDEIQDGFRPLDGESFSKRGSDVTFKLFPCYVSVP